ncbi:MULTISPECIES: hypothetical protein [Sphingobacterium]|jgi:hypothetical protein|uniref:hypothetical protein n=1 Tax=Sphingobacterium TaxID=28453 RepID=UPI0016044A90|nr:MULTISPECIES: hypothetical protein [unclassified Sphingobacterium]WET71686.1 MAG: hypothetical protein P0Y57_11545 [Sphingobacterium sp.]WON97074.1 hypothetical protein OK025_11865 [Sphingobacterium sp. UGAL515B_05]
MKIKMRLMYAVVLALVTFAFVGCSKDKDEPIQTGGSIDAAVGTYKGSLDLSNTSGPMFDKTLTVTKISDNTLKVEIGDKALKIPAKEFKVINNMNIAIQTAGVSPEGSFLFDVEKKTLLCQGKKTTENEVFFTFEGTKQ